MELVYKNSFRRPRASDRRVLKRISRRRLCRLRCTRHGTTENCWRVTDCLDFLENALFFFAFIIAISWNSYRFTNFVREVAEAVCSDARWQPRVLRRGAFDQNFYAISPYWIGFKFIDSPVPRRFPTVRSPPLTHNGSESGPLQRWRNVTSVLKGTGPTEFDRRPLASNYKRFTR